MGLGRHLQAPQRCRLHLRQPGQHRCHTPTAKGLLCRPKPLGRRIDLDQKQVLYIKPLCGQRWAKRHKRRTNQDHPRRGFASLL
jgi:hypothetical protein